MSPRALRSFIERMHAMGATSVQVGDVRVAFAPQPGVPAQESLPFESGDPAEQENDDMRLLLASTDEPVYQ